MTDLPEDVRKAAEEACRPNTALAVTMAVKETLQDAIIGGGVGAVAGATVGTVTGPGMLATTAIGAVGGAVAGGAAGLLFGIQDARKPDPNCVEEHLRPFGTPGEAIPKGPNHPTR